jgi:hypothetical protein
MTWKKIPGYPNYECLEDTRSGIKVRSTKRKRKNAMGIVTRRWKPARLITAVNNRYRLTHHISSEPKSYLDQDIYDATFRGKELVQPFLKVEGG